MEAEIDVAVIGAGPAGSASALALARLGRRAALVEPDPDRAKVGEMLRPSAVAALEALGVAPAQALGRHLRCAGVRSAWGGPEFAETDFIGNPYGDGWMLDRPVFESHLRACAVAAGALPMFGIAALSVERRPGGWRIGLSDGRAICARLLVDASGRSARWSRGLGGRRRAADRLTAFTVLLESAVALPERGASLLIEAADSGWWYLAPIGCARVALAYLTDSDLPTAYAAARRDGFAALLGATRHISAALDDRRSPSVPSPTGVAAASARTTPAAGPDWCAVGDAALARDPLSGSGIESALLDGARAAQACDAALKGDADSLARYADGIESAWTAHESARAAAYAAERRWPWSPFWARRGATGAPAAGRR